MTATPVLVPSAKLSLAGLIRGVHGAGELAEQGRFIATGHNPAVMGLGGSIAARSVFEHTTG